MAHDSYIKIRGARVHNLKNIDLDIPRNKLVVFTGVSGSGKTSLAFDTLYAEAERRFVESLSSYARQFLGMMEKPDVDTIEGLSPAISIDQKSVSKNPRSTVGTITEIYDYLRILYARIGVPHCPKCGDPVVRQNVSQIVDRLLKLPQGTSVQALAPLARDKKGEHKDVFAAAERAGYSRVRVNGAILSLAEAKRAALEKYKRHSIEAVVDRFSIGSTRLTTGGSSYDRARLADSVEQALRFGGGLMIASIEEPKPAKKSSTTPVRSNRMSIKGVEVSGRAFKQARDVLFSEHFACSRCHINLPEIEPRMFSFNSPHGACPECQGIGSRLVADAELVMPNKKLTIAEGAIRPWATASHRVGRQSWYNWITRELSKKHSFSLNVPVKELPASVLDMILYGDNGKALELKWGDWRGETSFEGVIPNLMRRWRETESEHTKKEIERYMVTKPCESCAGKRLRPEALAVKIGKHGIGDLTAMSIRDIKNQISKIKNELSSTERQIAEPLLKEADKRLGFLLDVGLDYLTLEREAGTLSGGESQRIRLASQIGSQLIGVLYILDEPSIGLHQRDQAQLIVTLKHLRDIGNTVIVVEHDPQTIREADWVVDVGPGAGTHGGKIIFSGSVPKLLKSRTLTGDYISGRKKVALRTTHYQLRTTHYLRITGAKEHNLKNIDVNIPLGRFVCVTGVSGSGKSTLVHDILANALLEKFSGAKVRVGAHEAILGAEQLDKVILVDQSPIGRTPRSNPATYIGAFSHVRDLFAATPEARIRGYKPGRFSFNVKGGRCEACEGQGSKKIEMYFLPDVYVDCEVCGGTRYNKEALEIAYKGKTIAEVLKMPAEEALKFFQNIPSLKQKLRTVVEVGLGYMELGQPAPALSGGEAQRVKLANELSKRSTGKTLYILDEPTTGLHPDDIVKLLKVLRALVERGNTVLVIEHNLDVIQSADWIIDLGPESGEGGGEVVAHGTPEMIKKARGSYTGEYLKKVKS
jgi:excinuclease ABC subunit A